MDYKTIERALEAMIIAREELRLVKDDIENAADHQNVVTAINGLNFSIVNLELVIRHGNE